MSAENETRKHILEVGKLISLIVKDLLTRSANHDSSKLVSPEVEVFETYTSKLKGMTYGSDEYKKCLDEMKPALDHHYACNRHHPEHFTHMKDMTLIDLIEMLCDWRVLSVR